MAKKSLRRSKKTANSHKKADQIGEKAKMLTSAEVIEILGITRSTFARWMRMGKLKGVKIGGSWRFAEEHIRALLEPPRPEDVTAGPEADIDIAFFAKRLKRRVKPPDDPVERAIVLAELLIDDAISSRASDIHLQIWEEKGVCVPSVAFRIDGALHRVRTLKQTVYNALVKRIKVMTALDLTENRMPQDGRIKLKDRKYPLDIRISVVPGIVGEAVCMRILDPAAVRLSLDQLLMTSTILDEFRSLLRRPYGFVLINGPTGSGKTTTLYAALNYLNRPEIKTVTVEDPVEYRLPGCTQIGINYQKGLTFAAAARSALRQDPDVILVGEIRNLETAQLCVLAALTGHLVLSTLHADSAPAALVRLMDMGLDPFLIGDGVIGVLNQRLIRLLCNKCREEREADPDDEERLRAVAADGGLAVPSGSLRVCYPVGCDACRGTGFRGRGAVNELLAMDRKIGAALRQKASLEEITQLALASGMKTIGADGVSRVLEGRTSPAEALRISRCAPIL